LNYGFGESVLRLQTFPHRKRRENRYRFYFDDNYSEYKSFYAYSEYEAIEKAIKIIRKKLSKQAILELETAKKKMKQEELIIEYGQEIQYEQLLDLAIGVYELNKNQDQRRAE